MFGFKSNSNIFQTFHIAVYYGIFFDEPFKRKHVKNCVMKNAYITWTKYSCEQSFNTVLYDFYQFFIIFKNL